MRYLLLSASFLSLVALSGCGLAWADLPGDQLAQGPAAPKTAPPLRPAPTQDTPPARQNPPPVNNADRKPEEAKSPLVRSLLEELNRFPTTEGTTEERSQIRDYLWNADEELARSLGPNARKLILDANKRRPSFRVTTKRERAALLKARSDEAARPKTGEPTPAVPPLPEVKPSPAPPMPIPPKPAPKKADDDPFGS
jgi:hypothetical protein